MVAEILGVSVSIFTAGSTSTLVSGNHGYRVTSLGEQMFVDQVIYV